MAQQDAPEIMTPDEVAILIRRSVETLKYWRYLGTRGPAHWKSGRRVFYDRSAVQAWMDEQRQAAQRAAGDGSSA